MKTNRKLAELVIADLRKWTGMDFWHHDRLTQQEARQVRQWAQENPVLVKAYRDDGHPEHAAVRLYAGAVDHFLNDHPQTPTGQPTPWPARPPAGKATPENPFGDLHPDEAEAVLAHARTVPEYREALLDASHPSHADTVANTTRMHEIIHSGSAAAGDAAATPASAGKLTAAQEAEVADLRSNPAFRDRAHPQHEAVMEKITAIHEAAHGGAAVPASAAPPRPAAAGDPRERIAALQGEPAFRDKSHPAHADTIARVTAAYGELHQAADTAGAGEVR